MMWSVWFLTFQIHVPCVTDTIDPVTWRSSLWSWLIPCVRKNRWIVSSWLLRPKLFIFRGRNICFRNDFINLVIKRQRISKSWRKRRHTLRLLLLMRLLLLCCFLRRSFRSSELLSDWRVYLLMIALHDVLALIEILCRFPCVFWCWVSFSLN